MAIYLCKGAVMSIFSNLFKKKNDEEENELEKQMQTSTQTDNEDEITAVIAAAIALMDEEEENVAAITAAIACMLGKTTNEFIVRNIKRTSEIDSLWALNGRMKLMR
jgi:Na+-transporting methylmalonyl-CoA/oxaloacetate decarboxylase gamma subunit